MNEDIRNHEIGEEELEVVSGGYKAELKCGWCGGKITILRDDNGNVMGYSCKGCGMAMGC